MKQNNSPWLTQLDQQRETKTLEQDIETDVVIVGGGIAGITTLYFLLKHTDKKVVLLEGHKIAHGATGHNAGQVVAEFERPLKSIVNEFGMKMAVDGLSAVESAWELIDEILQDTEIDVPLKEFIGYGGYESVDQLIADLETEYIKNEHGLIAFPVMVSRESEWFGQISEKYQKMVTVLDQEVISHFLDTVTDTFHAAIAQKKGVTNSALFTEALARWCIDRYPERCAVYEHTAVHGIEMEEVHPFLITNLAKIACKEIVLCTNGFENFYIHQKGGSDLDIKFHHEVHGAVGYMTGFTTKRDLDYLANYYYEKGSVRKDDPLTSDPYFYVTRRAFDHEGESLRLVTVGGPEIQLPDRDIYHREFDVAKSFHDGSISFMNKMFDMDDVKEKFFWHGLMGYTRTGLRIVGREPLDPRLMYNLGCNGVGILPSIMGARKIARHINNEEMTETIFDPHR